MHENWEQYLFNLLAGKTDVGRSPDHLRKRTHPSTHENWTHQLFNFLNAKTAVGHLSDHLGKVVHPPIHEDWPHVIRLGFHRKRSRLHKFRKRDCKQIALLSRKSDHQKRTCRAPKRTFTVKKAEGKIRPCRFIPHDAEA